MNIYPEHLAPGFLPAPSQPIASIDQDARCDMDKLFADMRKALEFAQANHLAVLSVNADRFGAYLVVAEAPTLQALFGEEAALVDHRTDAGLRIEIWLGGVENVRVFWREVKCAWEVTCVH